MLCVEFHRPQRKKKPKGELFTETTNWTAKYCQLAQPCFRLSPKPPSTRCSQTSQVEETRGRRWLPVRLQEEIPKLHVTPVSTAAPPSSHPTAPLGHPCGSSFGMGGTLVLPGLLSCRFPSSDNPTAPAASSGVFAWGSQSHQCVHLSFRERLLLFLPPAGVTTFFVGLHRFLFFPLIYPSASSSSTWNFAPPQGRNLSFQTVRVSAWCYVHAPVYGLGPPPRHGSGPRTSGKSRIEIVFGELNLFSRQGKYFACVPEVDWTALVSGKLEMSFRCFKGGKFEMEK